MLNLARHFRNAVQPLVQCALGLPSDERAVWLRDLRADCPSVACELERMMPPAPVSDVIPTAAHWEREIVPGSLEYLGLRC